MNISVNWVPLVAGAKAETVLQYCSQEKVF